MSAETIAGYCRACGKALDEASVHRAQGGIYCKEHAPEETAAGAASPYSNTPPPPLPNTDVSPGLAFVLGLIPGVGAVYNGQYAKGLIHVAVIGLAISILNSGAASGYEPLVTMLLIAFWAYMPFEAYHTAMRRRMGQPVDELAGLVPAKGARFPAAPVILIALGTILLLDNLGLLELRRALRYWPVLLIGAGLYMLYVRFTLPKEPRE